MRDRCRAPDTRARPCAARAPKSALAPPSAKKPSLAAAWPRIRAHSRRADRATARARPEASAAGWPVLRRISATRTTPTQTLPSSAGLSISVRSRAVLYGLLAVAAVAGIWLTRLSLFTLIASFLAFVALPRAGRKVPLTLVAVAAAASVLGFVRFLVREAVPGIVQGGTFATQDAAVSRLRELLFAEDSLRRLASIDPDGDRIGSAAFIDEMTGRAGLRGAARLVPPVLERYPESRPTALGPAVEINGYLFVI